jgi:hypothetical protein
MKNTTAKIISKRLHGWLDADGKHVPLPNLPDFILKLAVFSVPEEWIPVYKVSFDCDKDHEPAPDGWLNKNGRYCENHGIHSRFVDLDVWVPVFLGTAEDAIAEADCDCEQCRQARAREEQAPFADPVEDVILNGTPEQRERFIESFRSFSKEVSDNGGIQGFVAGMLGDFGKKRAKEEPAPFADFDSYVEHLQGLIPVMKAVQPLLHTFPDRKLTKDDVENIIAFDASLKIAEAGVAELEGRPIYVEPRNVKETLEDVVAGRLTIEDAAALIREAFVAEAEAYGDAHG